MCRVLGSRESVLGARDFERTEKKWLIERKQKWLQKWIKRAEKGKEKRWSKVSTQLNYSGLPRTRPGRTTSAQDTGKWVSSWRKYKWFCTFELAFFKLFFGPQNKYVQCNKCSFLFLYLWENTFVWKSTHLVRNFVPPGPFPCFLHPGHLSCPGQSHDHCLTSWLGSYNFKMFLFSHFLFIHSVLIPSMYLFFLSLVCELCEKKSPANPLCYFFGAISTSPL